MKKLIILLLSALSLTAVAQEAKKVAVYVTGDDAGINKVLGSKLVSAIARSNEYSAIERTESFLAELSKEQNYQRTGAVDDSELSRLGKQFGVQYVCVASVFEVFNEKYLSARLIDVESAQVERTASSSGAINSLESLINAANAVSSELLSSLSAGRQSDSKKVAVYVVKSDAAKNIGRVLGDKLVAGFTHSGRYIAIERTNSFLTQLNKEQNYQRTGAVDDSELSRLGKQFGVQYVCVADVSDVFGEKFVSARLIDVETAEVVNTHEVGGKLDGMNNCLNMANEIAKNLSKGTLAEQAEEARIEAFIYEHELKPIINQLNHNYIKIGNIYIAYPLGYTDNSTTCLYNRYYSNYGGHFNFAVEITDKCRIGEINKWRIPTSKEMKNLREKMIEYRINFISKYAQNPHYEEVLKKINAFVDYGCTYHFWNSDGKIVDCMGGHEEEDLNHNTLCFLILFADVTH